MNTIEKIKKDIILEGAGREMASIWITRAIHAETQEILDNQVFCLFLACTHTLAVLVLDISKNTSKDEDLVLLELLQHLKTEMNEIKANTGL